MRSSPRRRPPRSRRGLGRRLTPKPKSWQIAKQAEAAKREETRKARDGEPLILVDITALDPDVHNRHDKNAVNDVDKASTWRRTIEREYQKYSNDAGMIAAGTVRGCARGVYLAALQQLRDEVPGHYWVAVFPPASP